MAASKYHTQQLKKTVISGFSAFNRRITEPAGNVEPRQHLRIRLLSAFFILMVLNTLVAALLFRNTGGNIWIVMLAACGVLITGYLISRSKYYRAAIPLAVTIPAVPPIIIAILQPPQISLIAELMWLALPLLAAGLMLTLWQSHLVALSYIIIIIVFAFSGLLDFESLAPLIVFFLVITFFMIAFSALRKQDMVAEEKKLAEGLQFERTLQESEEKFSKAFQASPDSISISSLKDGKFIDVNESYTRTTGYKREELINHDADKFNMWVNPRDREKMSRAIEKHIKLNNEEMEFRHKSGEIGTSLVSTEYIQIAGQPCLLVVSADITNYKRTEKALTQSGQQLAQVFRLTPQQILLTKLEGGRIIDTNDNFNYVSGYTRPQSIGHTTIELGIWANQEDREKMKQMVKEKGRVINQEIDFCKKSGEIMTGLYSAEPIELNGEQCLVAIITDISEQKRMEKALKESEEKFSKAFHAIPERMSISRVRDGMILDVNESFWRATGNTREGTVGHTVYELGLWKNNGEREKIIKTIEEHGIVIDREIIHVTPNGNAETTLLSADIIEIGGERCVISISTDVTERKRMERALRESEEKFSKAFRAIPEAMAITRVKDGVFLDVNVAFCQAVKLTHDQVIGHIARELGLHDPIGRREQIIKTILEHGSISNEEHVIEPDSENPGYALFSADIIEIGDEPCLISVYNDITERKRMEEALANEAVRRRILIEQSRDGIVILDQSGAIYEANHRFAEMLGYSNEELMKLHVWEWSIEQPRETILKNLRQVDESGSHFETLHRRKDGSIYNVEISTNGAMFAGQKLIFSVCRDITERKRMEKALRESEEKFSKAFHALPESITISRVKDGVFIDVNENFCKVTGRSHDEIVGHTGVEIGLKERPGKRGDILKDIQEHGGIINREVVFNPQTEKMKATLFSADVIEIGGEPCMISISTDITERKRMEESLANEAVRRRILIEQSSDGIHIVDQNGALYEANHRFTEMLGYTSEEIKKLHVWDWVPDIPREKILEGLRQISEKGDRFEVKHRRKDGSIFDVEISNNGAMFAGQKLIFSVCRDITERKQAEDKLRQTMMELKLSSVQLKATNKELESFSYSVSHDLRSPLRSIDGFSQALLEDYAPKLDETARDYLNRMRNASQKMGDLIDGLLKLSRLTRGEMKRETIDLSMLAQEISERLLETNPERKTEFIISPGLRATGDPQMLRVLMENLLGNAWKFTQKVPEARIEFGSAISNGKQTFFIKDNGAGFDMAYADKLFGAFQRLHDTRDFPGTGIGLATVQRIINRHSGNIWAEGTVGQGAVFYFTL